MKKITFLAATFLASTLSFAQVKYSDFENGLGDFLKVYSNEGALDNAATPPAANANVGTKVAKWERPSGPLYPFSAYTFKRALVDVAPYASASATKKLTIDVYTDAPIGTVLDVTLGDSTHYAPGVNSYPMDTYTVFSAPTTKQNEWHTLTLNWKADGVWDDAQQKGVPFGGTASTAVTRYLVQFGNGTTLAYNLYFDNPTGPELTADPSGLNEIADNSDLTVYPNPSNGTVNMNLNNILGAKVAVSISNVLGQEVFSTVTNNNTLTADLSNVEKGIYFVKINNNNNISVKKVYVK